MKVDIGKVIRLVLEERHVASLPSLGTFRIKVKPAFLNQTGEEIHPPSADLVFDEKSINDHSLVEFISDLYQISKVKSLKVLETFEETVAKNVKSNKSVRVKGLGKFHAGDNDTIIFLPNQNIAESIFYGLKPVNIAIKPIAQEKTIVEETLQTDTVPKPTETPEIIQSQENQVSNEAKELKGEKTKDMSDSSFDNQDYTRDYNGPSKWSYLIKPLLYLITFLVLSTFIFKKCASWTFDHAPKDDATAITNGQESTDSAESDTYVNDTQDEKENISTQSEAVDNAHDQDTKPMFIADDGEEVFKYEDVNPHPMNCIIITGTFSKDYNVVKMIKKLESKGYDSYTENASGDLTRVGFFFACDEENLESYIYNIRQTVSENAWYLKPRIHVE